VLVQELPAACGVDADRPPDAQPHAAAALEALTVFNKHMSWLVEADDVAAHAARITSLPISSRPIFASSMIYAGRLELIMRDGCLERLLAELDKLEERSRVGTGDETPYDPATCSLP
jgi:hypothetical protein